MTRGRAVEAATILASVDPLEARTPCAQRAAALKRMAGKRGYTLIIYTDACLDPKAAEAYAAIAEELRAAGLNVAFAYPGPRLRDYLERVAPMLAKTSRVYAGSQAAAAGRLAWRG